MTDDGLARRNLCWKVISPRVEAYMPEFISLMAKRSQWSHGQPSVKMQMVGEVSLRAVVVAAALILYYLCKHEDKQQLDNAVVKLERRA
jgi:hypothetical protein